MRGDACRGRRGGDLHHRLGPRGRNRDDVEAARVEGGERQGHPRREVLDVHMVVRVRDLVRELVPAGVADDGELHAAPFGEAECGLERPFGRRFPERRDEGDVVTPAEPDAGHARPQVELRHHLVERRLLRAGDEYRVGVEHRRPRRRRKGLPSPRDGDAAERDVHLVDRETVQAGDRFEGEDRFGHQLRCGAGARQTGDCCSMAHAATSVKSASRVTTAPVSASVLKR